MIIQVPENTTVLERMRLFNEYLDERFEKVDSIQVIYRLYETVINETNALQMVILSNSQLTEQATEGIREKLTNFDLLAHILSLTVPRPIPAIIPKVIIELKSVIIFLTNFKFYRSHSTP